MGIRLGQTSWERPDGFRQNVNKTAALSLAGSPVVARLDGQFRSAEKKPSPGQEGGGHPRGPATHLKLPVGRLEELLRLVCGATSRQNKLVDHHLVPEFVHIYRHDRFLLDARSLQSRKRWGKK